MAISMGGGSSDAPLGDMNTTPLIDVMLVLLIMFIITLPIQTHAVKIDLPIPDPNPEPITIEPEKNKVFIADNGTVLWNGQPVDYVRLASLLEQTKLRTPTPELQFEPHPNARYIIVDQVLAVIKRANVGNLGFVGNERYAREF
jgi:biopolymer transport protein ExbD